MFDFLKPAQTAPPPSQPTKHSIVINEKFKYYEISLGTLSDSFSVSSEADFKILCENLTKIRDKYSFKKPLERASNPDIEKIQKLRELNETLLKNKRTLENEIEDLNFKLEDQQDKIARLEEEKRRLVENLMQKVVSQNTIASSKNIEDSITIDFSKAKEQSDNLQTEVSKAKEEIEKLKKHAIGQKEKIKELKEEINSLQEGNSSLEQRYRERKKKDKSKIIELNEAIEKLKKKEAKLKSEIVSLKATIELSSLEIKQRTKDNK